MNALEREREREKGVKIYHDDGKNGIKNVFSIAKKYSHFFFITTMAMSDDDSMRVEIAKMCNFSLAWNFYLRGSFFPYAPIFC